MTLFYQYGYLLPTVAQKLTLVDKHTLCLGLSAAQDSLYNRYDMRFASLAETSLFDDAFVGLADEIALATTQNKRIFCMMLRPSDKGLVMRMGAVPLWWKAVYVVMLDKGIRMNRCIYDALPMPSEQRCIYDAVPLPMPSEQCGAYFVESPIDSLVSTVEQFERVFTEIMRPAVGVLYDHRSNAILNAYYRPDDVDAIAIYGKTRRETVTNIRIVPRDRAKIADMLDRQNIKHWISVPDRLVSISGGVGDWRPNSLHRMPRLLAQYLDFYLAAPDLPPYVVLWICDFLPFYCLHREHRKIYWLQRIYHTIGRVRELREQRRVAASTAEHHLRPIDAEWPEWPSER